ncbi:TOM20 [Lepeophtheirus salmonis]|uniref:TOM20 n=1 Tax=Lepeophtheirus salmonis TaxID=72036 RepID=A0A7R8CMS0_LEPSM|nr:TOM20 [Lepeophtheirus salmonis]CAF2868837.1 TOM20 [Lepeophtheirus salmonis]
MVSSTQIGVGLGLSAAAFLGYCLYFDNRRRRAPDFRQKLREKRRAAAKKAKYGEGTSDIELPDFSDHEAVQRFFLREVQTGEDLLGQGNITKGVEHLSLAVAVCGQPHALLGVLQQTLPNHHLLSPSSEFWTLHKKESGVTPPPPSRGSSKTLLLKAP